MRILTFFVLIYAVFLNFALIETRQRLIQTMDCVILQACR